VLCQTLNKDEGFLVLDVPEKYLKITRGFLVVVILNHSRVVISIRRFYHSKKFTLR
jgi:hypothetical protein